MVWGIEKVSEISIYNTSEVFLTCPVSHFKCFNNISWTFRLFHHHLTVLHHFFHVFDSPLKTILWIITRNGCRYTSYLKATHMIKKKENTPILLFRKYWRNAATVVYIYFFNHNIQKNWPNANLTHLSYALNVNFPFSDVIRNGPLYS